jgi:predicted PurR-regulated permease PerM
MFILGIIASIFWALVVAVILWVLCAFSGKLINKGFSMSLPQHLFCLAVAVPTVVLLAVVFTCNKLNRQVERANSMIVRTMTAGGQMNLQNIDAGNITSLISSEYPMLRRFIDADELNVENIAQGDMQLAAESFTSSIRSRIKSTRRKALIAVVLLQAVVFGAVFYMAGKSSRPARSNYLYDPNDYI